MEKFRLNSLNISCRLPLEPVSNLTDPGSPWRLNRVAYSEEAGALLIAGVNTIRGFIMDGSRDYEKSFELVDSLFKRADLVIRCPVDESDINCIECGYVKLDDKLAEILVVVTDSGNSYVWKCSDWSLLRGIENQISTWSIAISQEHDLIGLGSNEHTVRVYSLSDGNLVHQFDHMHNVPAISFDLSGYWLYSGSIDGTCGRWPIGHANSANDRFNLPESAWAWSVCSVPHAQIERSRPEFNRLDCRYRQNQIFQEDFLISRSILDSPLMTNGDEDEFLMEAAEFAGTSMCFEEEYDWTVDASSEAEWMEIEAEEQAIITELTRTALLQHFQSSEVDAFEIEDPPRQSIFDSPIDRFYHRQYLPALPVPVQKKLETTFLIESNSDIENLVFCFSSDSLYILGEDFKAPLLVIDMLRCRGFYLTEVHETWTRCPMNRFFYSTWIPEISCILAANQTGYFLLIHLTKAENFIQVSLLAFPSFDEDLTSLIGVTIKPVVLDEGRQKFWEILAVHSDGTFRSFKVYREPHCLPTIQTIIL